MLRIITNISRCASNSAQILVVPPSRARSELSTECVAAHVVILEKAGDACGRGEPRLLMGTGGHRSRGLRLIYITSPLISVLPLTTNYFPFDLYPPPLNLTRWRSPLLFSRSLSSPPPSLRPSPTSSRARRTTRRVRTNFEAFNVGTPWLTRALCRGDRLALRVELGQHQQRMLLARLRYVALAACGAFLLELTPSLSVQRATATCKWAPRWSTSPATNGGPTTSPSRTRSSPSAAAARSSARWSPTATRTASKSSWTSCSTICRVSTAALASLGPRSRISITPDCIRMA